LPAVLPLNRPATAPGVARDDKGPMNGPEGVNDRVRSRIFAA
jgi:hypothetical protein